MEDATNAKKLRFNDFEYSLSANVVETVVGSSVLGFGCVVLLTFLGADVTVLSLLSSNKPNSIVVAEDDDVAVWLFFNPLLYGIIILDEEEGDKNNDDLDLELNLLSICNLLILLLLLIFEWCCRCRCGVDVPMEQQRRL